MNGSREADWFAPVERRGTNSMKWRGEEYLLTPEERAHHPLPLWVADMDFLAPPAVREALAHVAEFGVYGYPAPVSASYLEAVVDWQRRRHHWAIDAEWIVPAPGVITALKVVVQEFSSPGDSVLIQPPVYGHFRDDVELNGRRVVNAPLRLEGERYVFDPEVFRMAIRSDTRLFILSNPHNPTGNVWSESDLRQMGEICLEHGVIVVSDEVHQDFVVAPERHHVPFASLGGEFARGSLTCTSASKTFNLAGLQVANIIIADPPTRRRFHYALERNQFTLLNLFGSVATETAYREGEEWLEALRAHLVANHALFAAGVNALPGWRALPMDSLYLAWVDARGLGQSAEDLRTALLRAGLWFDWGTKFGEEGRGFVRVNLGTPRVLVEETVERLRRVEF
jgi:cystathionine beta-lyase